MTLNRSTMRNTIIYNLGIVIVFIMVYSCGNQKECFSKYEGLRIIYKDVEDNNLLDSLNKDHIKILGITVNGMSIKEFEVVNYIIPGQEEPLFIEINDYSLYDSLCFEQPCDIVIQRSDGINDEIKLEISGYTNGGCYGERVTQFIHNNVNLAGTEENEVGAFVLVVE